MYLTDMFEKGLQYTTISSARSALANVISIPGVPSISEHPLVKRFLKGVYNLRPPVPRYSHIWDTSIVIQYLRSLDNHVIPFKFLVYKLVTLLTLLSGQRVSTLHKFRTDEMQVRTTDVLFYVSALLKQDQPNRRPKDPFIYHAYPADTHLCPVTLIHGYLHLRNALVPPTEKAFFITHGKPFHAASKDTLARWVKDTMVRSGVDTAVFKPHSCRSASTSAAKAAGVPLATILKCGQWSKESNFYKFYERDILWDDVTDTQAFGESMLHPQ